MGKLCQDMVLNIVVRLPVKSILRFRCVSKDWCKLLKDPDFVKKHLRFAIEMNKFSLMMHPLYVFDLETYTLAYDPSSSTLSNCVSIRYPWGTTFWGTCNGLVCLSTLFDDLVLWNPATKEFKEVPPRPIESVNEISNYFLYGFGYDEKFDDFKVVSMLGIQNVYNCVVHIYSLKSNSWKRLENIPYDLYHPRERDISQASVVNGDMHWLAETDSAPNQVILSFDFKDDRFDKMPLPSILAEYGFGGTYLCSLGGSLCLFGSHLCGDGIKVWEMKEYGVTESWVKLFTINQETISHFFRHLVPLQFVKNGKVLLAYDTNVDFHLDLYDLKHQTTINIKAHNANGDWYAATTFVYVESLVPLNSGTYVWQQETEDFEAGTRAVNRGHSVEAGVEEEDIAEGFPASPKTFDDDSEEGAEEKVAEGFPVSPKLVDEARETSPEKTCEMLEIRKLDLETRKMDLETRTIELKIREQENQHMSMDTSKMNALQLKWWQTCAKEITEKHRVSDMSIVDVNDDKEAEDEDHIDVEQEEDIENRKKKAKMT
ncbi:hypothetical protein C5167_044641 [Papaver somniferum]|uniref:F-box domain-containing protein n=1 Tax=Papaver somniferum TaxID=3469 RepID=A0A4Y7LCQ6_PAPSO|nr:F-box/kelch-repeat protein At3g06240-like [Papaver somniferum]XP_026420729.1 F-box/kelch-repeat protein At3g06240-like [Papaver somniferum]RZC82061.1 hypothetical protein C5167_044641 [Papaver somniferum]